MYSPCVLCRRVNQEGRQNHGRPARDKQTWTSSLTEFKLQLYILVYGFVNFIVPAAVIVFNDYIQNVHTSTSLLVIVHITIFFYILYSFFLIILLFLNGCLRALHYISNGSGLPVEAHMANKSWCWRCSPWFQTPLACLWTHWPRHGPVGESTGRRVREELLRTRWTGSARQRHSSYSLFFLIFLEDPSYPEVPWSPAKGTRWLVIQRLLINDALL